MEFVQVVRACESDWTATTDHEGDVREVESSQTARTVPGGAEASSRDPCESATIAIRVSWATAGLVAPTSQNIATTSVRAFMR